MLRTCPYALLSVANERRHTLAAVAAGRRIVVTAGIGVAGSIATTSARCGGHRRRWQSLGRPRLIFTLSSFRIRFLDHLGFFYCKLKHNTRAIHSPPVQRYPWNSCFHSTLQKASRLPVRSTRMSTVNGLERSDGQKQQVIPQYVQCRTWHNVNIMGVYTTQLHAGQIQSTVLQLDWLSTFKHASIKYTTVRTCDHDLWSHGIMILWSSFSLTLSQFMLHEDR